MHRAVFARGGSQGLQARSASEWVSHSIRARSAVDYFLGIHSLALRARIKRFRGPVVRNPTLNRSRDYPGAILVRTL